MNTEKETAINDFLGNEIEPQDKIESDKKKVIKSDNSIIEHIDKIIIAENGKQLLREQY